MSRRTACIALMLIAALAGGCGKGAKKQTEAEKFKLPDSVVAPKAEFTFTVDTYDAVTGGVMGDSQIEMHYPAADYARQIALMTFKQLKKAYQRVDQEIGAPAERTVVVIGAADLDEYKVVTHKEWWYYGLIKGDTLYSEPFDVMLKRNIANVGYAQRFAQMALNRRSGGRIPVWMREAVATRVAGEGAIVKMQSEEFRLAKQRIDFSPQEIDRYIAEGTDRYQSRISYFCAYRMLENLLAFSSMDNVYKFVDRLKEGSSLDAASQAAFGMSYTALVDKVRVDKGHART
jgi:hypothetical protein